MMIVRLVLLWSLTALVSGQDVLVDQLKRRLPSSAQVQVLLSQQAEQNLEVADPQQGRSITVVINDVS